MKRSALLFVTSTLLLFAGCKQVAPPAPLEPLPTESQARWQTLEEYAFIHFSMNTFTDMEWGFGDNDPKLFNPTELDCRQWARIVKAAGMKGIILTTKHHDGFCLWPSEYTDYSVKASPWKDGKGDLLAELAEACKEYDLKLGFYLSPWDRNHAEYGRPEYITYFRNQLKEILTNYGEIFEVWFDGANGGDGYYGGANEIRRIDNKTYYDWPNTYKLVYELQPDAILFSDAGPGTRWCGNEEGWVKETNWSLLRRDEFWPGCPNYLDLQTGHEDGTHWVPAEVDVSIRPGWFYHESEDHKVKSYDKLVDIYYTSVGRNANLILNIPIDRRGLIHPLDSAALMKRTEVLQADFAQNLAKGKKAEASHVRGNSRRFNASKVLDGREDTYWTTDDSITAASITINLGRPTMINRILLQEPIRMGQRVKSFSVEAFIEDKWEMIDQQTTIGYKRILRFPTVNASQVRVNILDSRACPLISNIELFNAPKLMAPPVIERNREGVVSFVVADPDVLCFYTTDGSTPTNQSIQYTEPFSLKEPCLLQAVTFDPSSEKYSEPTRRNIDISRENWIIVNSKEERSLRMLDGNLATAAILPADKTIAEVIIDLGKGYSISGFRYLPDQSRYPKGIVSHYRFYTSTNGNQWTLASEGEFSNIKNNPIEQTKTFDPTGARFVKFTAVKTTDSSQTIGIAEIEIITQSAQ